MTRVSTRIVRLSQGEIWVKTNDGGRAIEVETPVATAAAADSEFSMKVDVNGNSTLTVIRGAAEFATAFGMCQTRPSSASRSVRGKACTPPTPANTAAAVSWTRGLFD